MRDGKKKGGLNKEGFDEEETKCQGRRGEERERMPADWKKKREAEDTGLRAGN